MIYCSAVLTAILFALIDTVYIYCFDNNFKKIDKKKLFADAIKSKKRLFIITIAFFVILSVSSTYFSIKYGFTWYSLQRNLAYIYLLYLLSVTDIKKKIIPNKIILSMLILRIPFLAVELYYNSDMWSVVLKNAGIGFMISVIISLIMLLVSRNQLGGGDVKLLSLIGLYTGSANVLTVMMFSFIYCAIGGVLLMLGKKVKLKDTVPLAPFVFAGMLTYFVLVYFWGMKG